MEHMEKEVEEDQESVLSNLDFNGQEEEVKLGVRSELNLSEYCVSSDADTEKMDEEEEESHPKLSTLIGEQVKRELEEGETNDTKRPHLDGNDGKLDNSTLVDPVAEGSESELSAQDDVDQKPLKEATETLVSEPAKNESAEPSEEVQQTEETAAPAVAEEESVLEPASDEAEQQKEENEATSVKEDHSAPTQEDSGLNVQEEQLPETEPVTQQEQGQIDNETGVSQEEQDQEDNGTLIDMTGQQKDEQSTTHDSTITNGPENLEDAAGSATVRDSTSNSNNDNVSNNADEDEGEVGDADDDEDEDEDIVEDEEDEEESQVGDSTSKDEVSKKRKRKKSFILPMVIEEQRQQALKDITEIEHKFAELRQRLYENKLERLETELQMCVEGSHPELHEYYEKISKLRDFKLNRTYQRQKYELKRIDIETRATRTMIHQNFLKCVNELRSQLLQDTTTKWYDINKERRDMDIIIPDINYHVPIKTMHKTLSCITGYAGPAQPRKYLGEPVSEDLQCENIEYRYQGNPVDKLEVIVDRMRLNNELSDLEGLKRFYNAFPGAPNLSSLRDSEIQEDIQYLK